MQFGASYTASPYGYGSITKNIYLTANSGCGTTLRTYTFYIVSIGGFGKIAVYPNPTRDALNVTITKETEAGIVNGKETKQNSKFDKTTFSLSPINTKQVLKKWTFNEVKTMNYNLYIKGLATGVYILTIERNGEIATTKVIIL